MKSLLCLGITLVLFGLAGAATPPARLASTHIDSLTLVKLLHLDEMMSRIVNQDAQQAFAAGRITEHQLTCLQTTPADFTEGVATVARTELTTGELSSALAYLRSKDGRKFGEMTDDFNANRATQPDMSSAEVAAFTSFHTSPAGTKLFKTSMLMQTKSMDDFIGAYAKRVKAKCELTQPLQPPDDSKP